jgi:hypothetical protein
MAPLFSPNVTEAAAEEVEVVAGEAAEAAAGAEAGAEAEVLPRKVVVAAVGPEQAAVDPAVADLHSKAAVVAVARWTAVVAAAVNSVARKVGAEAMDREPIAAATVESTVDRVMAEVEISIVAGAAIAMSTVEAAVGVMACATAVATAVIMSAATDAAMAGDQVSASISMTDINTVTANGFTAAQSSPAVATGGIATAVASTGKPVVCPKSGTPLSVRMKASNGITAAHW